MDSTPDTGSANGIKDPDSTAALLRAKHPRAMIAGPYGHPFHPILVTVPIGAWVASVVFDLVALGNAEEEAVFAEGAYWLIGIGIGGALVAAVFGLLDLSMIERGTRAFRVGLTHMTLNLAVVALFIVDFVLRAANGYEEATTLGFVLSLIAVGLLGASGWLGGKLAYHYGVRVSDEQHQIEGYR